ncbi:hypothetical protein SKAU_G00260130 [Synaphobranchus kaupii]|uniref:Ankyrin 3 n=1 Tax=Synaphobranchus kaupii TaxID=118154 RepID=A0A9Q1F4J4_SYNKA|nr:hypothetical protein SKAU_G00260130 [Synaphobranchus kaupii]
MMHFFSGSSSIPQDDQTPLHISSRLGKADIVQHLLQRGASANASTTSGYTPLHLAAREGHEEVASALLEHGASLSATTKKGFSPLHVAAKYGKMEVANLLLQKDASPDAAGKSGLTPLHVAAHYDNQKVALLLLDQGASPHAAAKNGYTPLHIAAKKNQMDIGTTLLEYGADTGAVTRQGITPLHLAAQEGNVDMVSLLLAKSANVNLGNKSGLTPLHLAAQEDKVNVAEVLANHGAAVEPQTKMGYTPLHVACHYGNIKMVNYLLQNRAKVNAKTKNGYTPLHQAAQQGHTHIINILLQHGSAPNELTVNGNTALSIARRLGYISVVDTLKVVTEENLTTATVTEKHKMNVPETMNEVLDMSDDEDYTVHKSNVPEILNEDCRSDVDEGEDAMTGDTDKYLRPQDLKELGDDSLPQEGYMGFSLGARSASSDRSNTLNRSSFTRDSMMIEEILAPKDTHLAVTRECNSDSMRRYSWAADTTDNAHLVSSPIHSGFLVSFMVDARGGSMRGSRHNGMRIIIPPRKCTAPTRITCRLVRRHKLASPPPMVEGEGLVSRLVEVGPAGAQFLGPVIVEIPHFGSMRGKERELIVLRSDNGETWKEHQYDYRTEELSHLLNGMDEELDSSDELEKKRICRIVTRDFPQYFAVVSRIKQESNHMGPEGGVLTSMTVPMVRASFPEGALTKRIRVGLQAQPVPDELMKKMVGTRATFSPIVTVEPRRRKFHKPITMTIPVPPPSGERIANGYRGDSVPCLRLLCSITGGTSPAQWEDITGTTPLSFVTECVSFTTNVSARFWLADCHQVPETVGLAAQLYRELICVPYLAKFVVFAKMNDPVESRLRCFCMTDDKVDKTLEQQENFEEVARSKDIEVLEGKPIHVDCYGNVAPLIKTGQQLVFNFYAFKENRLPFCVKIRDISQEPCGRLSFLKEPKTTKGLPQTAICNLNITLPTLKKADKPERRHTFASLALRKRYSYLAEPATKTVDRSAPRTLPAGYAYKPVFSTRSYQAWSAAPVTVPGQAKSGFGSLSSSSSNTPSASPLKSVWSITSASPIKSTLGASTASSVKSVSDVASPIRSFRTISSPIKTVVQQAQYPVQVSTSLLSSPGKTVTDPVSVKGLAASLASRTSPVMNSGSLLERSSIAMTPPTSPKSTLNMYSLPYKSVIASASPMASSPMKSVSGLSSIRSSADATGVSKGLLVSSLSSPLKSSAGPSAAALINGTVSPVKYPSSSAPLFSGGIGSLQERIQATTHAATNSISAAMDEAEKTFNSCSASGYGTLKSISSSPSSSYQSMRSSPSTSIYASLRSPPASSTTSVTSSTITVPVYSVINVIPEPQFKRLPEVTRSAAALVSPLKTRTVEPQTSAQSSFAKTLSPVKSSLFVCPAALKSTATSPLSSSQEILKDVAEMKEDLIRMSAILQTDTSPTAKSSQSDSPKEQKIEDEEPYRIVEKVKQDLVKVSEILSKDALRESKTSLKNKRAEEDWVEFSKDEIHESQQNGRRCPLSYDTDGFQVRTKSITDRDFNLARVVDYLTNDIGASSLSKISDVKCRYDEVKREGEEKQKRILKPTMALQEHKLKMPPSNMRSSPSEKELCKLAAEVLFGTDAVVVSPDDMSHDQDKSPLSDSGFETRSEKTPSAPQSAESTGPKPLFHDVPIPPVITETRTEVVHVIRSYEPSEESLEPTVEESRVSMSPVCIQAEPQANGPIKDKAKGFQMKINSEDDSASKGMCVKEETHITTTTRMVFHKPQVKESASERIEETMSVQDIMKAFQSGRDPSRELAGLFEHKVGENHKGTDSLPQILEKDIHSKPKVERIIEVHIEKGNKAEPTEVIIRETKNHPEKEMYMYMGDHRIKELTNKANMDDDVRQEEEELTAEELLPPYLESSRVNTPVSQEEDSRPGSAQLITDDSYRTLKLLSQHSVEYHDDDPTDHRGESYRFAEKMLLSEKFDMSHSDTEEPGTDQAHARSSELQDAERHKSERASSSPKKEFLIKSSRDASNTNADQHKLTLLHYTAEPGSPKHSVWMRVTEDKVDRNREKLIYEDRVDRTVKEAEEKLSEVSQFFRDKTEKLNDELQSPEKKACKGSPRETRSGPSSTCSSPERMRRRNGGSSEEWAKDRMGQLFNNERKCASLPSSPERRILSQFNDDRPKQGDSISQSTDSKASPIAEVPEELEEEEEDKASFFLKDSPPGKRKTSLPETTVVNKDMGKKPKEKRVAYIEFPPPPPLDPEPSDTEKKASCHSSETETEMMEVNLQEEHDKHLLAEPIIRVQPPSPLPTVVADSDSSDDESVFQPIPLKKYTFKISEEEEMRSKPKGLENNGNCNGKEIGSDAKGEDLEFEQNGNDQSVTDCSIATTAEFSHDTDATEIDSLDGYELQDEDDGLTEQNTNLSKDNRKDMKDSISNPCRLEVIEEEKGANEEGANGEVKDSSDRKSGDEQDAEGIYSLEGRHPDRQGFADSYFNYQLEEDTTFKTVATKGLDFDPWSSKGGEGEVFDARIKDDEPKPFGLTVEDGSQATTPDTTPARTPTDESTPSSEPNPFPFHEGKMFEMTRGGAIDMSKRDFVEERLQFFQIGEHTSEGRSGVKGNGVRSPGGATSQAGDKALEITENAPTDITTTVKCNLIQTSTDCLNTSSGDIIIAETSSCTITASKVDSKLRTPIKMGIAASITVKKDAGSVELTDCKADSLDSQNPEHSGSETYTGRLAASTSSERRDFPKENSNNNNNLESSNVQANYIQCGSVVFNLQSSSEPTLQQVSRIEASFCRDSEGVRGEGEPWGKRKTNGSKEAEVRPPKSRLPVKAPGSTSHALSSATQGKQKPRHAVKPEVRKRVDNPRAVEPRSRIPVKEVNRSNVSSPVSVQIVSRSVRTEKGHAKQVPSRLPDKDRTSLGGGSTCEAGREVCKRSIEYFKGLSGETLKLVDRLSDEEKKMQSEISDEDSTSRSTSLSEASQPSLTSRSARQRKSDAAPVRAKAELAGSERRRRNRRTGGNGGSQAPTVETKPSPESPCERTDLRMAIVADHLGLSWTELAREMNFSVDEINHIRVENPNSLTAQSFMLLKKWVKRDGKDATTDALTPVLTKVNRMDIVTLLEGPIFDYGNISGTRSFADDNSAFLDQADGYHNLQMELGSPPELGLDSPELLWKDDVFREEEEEEESRVEASGKGPCRPCRLVLSEDPGPSSPDGPRAGGREEGHEEEETGVSHGVGAPSERRGSGSAVKESGSLRERRGAGEEALQEEGGAGFSPLKAWALALGEGAESGSDEEEEEEDVACEQLNSLWEESSEGGEREAAMLGHSEQAQRDLSSIPGWGNDAPNVTVETQSQGRSLNTDLNNQQENSQEPSSESITLSSKERAGKPKHNGEHAHPLAPGRDATYPAQRAEGPGRPDGAGPER